METKITVLSDPAQTKSKLKVAAYVRVSTDSEKQQHSFEAQKQYWENKLSNCDDYEYVGVFADEGISGKSMRNRTQFLVMIEQAKSGKIQVIFTKSVSRFGRNFKEILQTIRELRDKYNVAVYFEEENMKTNDTLSDTILSIRAMVAEQELKDFSDNQKWSIRRKFREGFVSHCGRLYGYNYVKDAEGNTVMEINPEQAKTVKLIYNLYENGMGTDSIAKELDKQGIKTYTNKNRWSKERIRYILTCEKYIGDAISQKTYTEDFKEVINRNDNPDIPMYYIENNHEGIVDKDTFYRVQNIHKKRSNKKLIGREQKRRIFTGKIICGNCQSVYRHKMYQYKGKALYGLWICSKYLDYGKKHCSNHSIKEKILEDCFVKAFNKFVTIKTQNDKLQEQENNIKLLKEKDNELFGLMHNGYINKLDYITEHNILINKIKELEKEILAKSQDNLLKMYKKEITVFDEKLIDKFIKEVTVQNWTVTFIFKNGVIIKEKYSNGTPGNKVGWKDKLEAK